MLTKPGNKAFTVAVVRLGGTVLPPKLLLRTRHLATTGPGLLGSEQT